MLVKIFTSFAVISGYSAFNFLRNLPVGIQRGQILQVDYDSSVEYALIVNTIILRSLHYEDS